MIADSEKYKQYISQVATWLSRGVPDREASLLKLERELFLSFFYVRKLIEAKKLSGTVITQSHRVEWHPVTGRVDHLNWHRLDDFVDFSEQSNEPRDLEFICNRFVHSFIFAPATEAKQVTDILVATDRDRGRDRKIYRFPISLLSALLTTVGEDNQAQGKWERDTSGLLTTTLG